MTKFRLVQIESINFVDYKLNIAQNIVPYMAENIMGKWENALSHFLTIFSNIFFPQERWKS